MTTLASPTVRPRPTRPSLPTDATELHALADRLDGRPVPGVRITERRFLDWRPSDVRAEWEKGQVILMTTPSGEHVDLNGWVLRLLTGFVNHHNLGVVHSPFAVRLPELGRVRVPDVLFVRRSRSRLFRPDCMDGPPDSVVEIVSPGSTALDVRAKYAEYAAAGVREYWVVSPGHQFFEATP